MRMTRARASPATLHNHMGGRAPGGQGEEGRTAPRWSHCAAAGVRRVLDGWPTRKVRYRLMELAADGAAWARMAAELRGFLSDAHHYTAAIDAGFEPKTAGLSSEDDARSIAPASVHFAAVCLCNRAAAAQGGGAFQFRRLLAPTAHTAYYSYPLLFS